MGGGERTVVTLLKDYEQQTYFLNTADDIGDIVFRNGDQVFLMDQDLLLIYDEGGNNWYPVPTGGGGAAPEYGIKEATYVTGTWSVSSHNNVVTVTMPTVTHRYIALTRPIEFAVGDTLKLKIKRTGGTIGATDIVLTGYPITVSFMTNQTPTLNTVYEVSRTNTYGTTITVTIIDLFSRNGAWTDVEFQFELSLNDVVLFSSIT